ncbi:MAG: hypothetical protein IPN90_13825 [Elusimicrobia bacterium]|nr:hypothetical protein [Elusimicrobiota bacterium]
MALSGVTAVAAVLASVDPFGWARTSSRACTTHFSNAVVMGLLCLTLWATEGPPARTKPFSHPGTEPFDHQPGIVPVFYRAVLVCHRWESRRSTPPKTGGSWNRAESRRPRFVLRAYGSFFDTNGGPSSGVLLDRVWALGRTFSADRLRPFSMSVCPRHALATSPHRFSISPATVKKPKSHGRHDPRAGIQSTSGYLYPNIPLAFRVHQTWAY